VDSSYQSREWKRQIAEGGWARQTTANSVDSSYQSSEWMRQTAEGSGGLLNGAMERTSTTPPRQAPVADNSAPINMPSNLLVVLNELSRIAKDPGQMDSLTAEQSTQAATLVQWAQQGLHNMKVDCQQKILELEHSEQGHTPSSSVRPAPGLSPCPLAAAPGLRLGGFPPPSLPPGVLGAPIGIRPQLSSPAEVAIDASAAKQTASQKNSFGTLRSHLEELKAVDEDCIFVARRINKLGFNSREILKMHFSWYGEVYRVLVAHSKANTFCDQAGKLRFRPGGLGLVVMKRPASVKAILSCEDHIIAGHKMSVQSFHRNNSTMSSALQRSEDTSSTAQGQSEEGGSSEPCDGTGTSGGSGPLPSSPSEGGSSEPCEQQEPNSPRMSCSAGSGETPQ
jgi:hypothetical protein